MRQTLFILFSITLFGCETAIKSKPEPVIVTTPGTEASNFETNDSIYLKIKIQDEGYQLSFLNKNLLVTNRYSLDSFLRKNNQSIKKEKVIVTGFNNTEKEKDFVDILSKNGISRFRTNTQ